MITGNRLTVLPRSTGSAFALTLGSKILHSMNINKYNKYKELYERANNFLYQLIFFIIYLEIFYKIL